MIQQVLAKKVAPGLVCWGNCGCLLQRLPNPAISQSAMVVPTWKDALHFKVAEPCVSKKPCKHREYQRKYGRTILGPQAKVRVDPFLQLLESKFKHGDSE